MLVDVVKILVFSCENCLQISLSFNHGISIGNKAWKPKWLPQFKRHAFSIIVFQGCIPRGSYFENREKKSTLANLTVAADGSRYEGHFTTILQGFQNEI